MNETLRVAVTSRSFCRHPALCREIAAQYRHVKLNTAGEALSGARLADFLRGHDAAIVALERVTAELLDAVPELRILSKYGVGLDGLDLAALRSRGIRLGWTGGVNRHAVAELAVAFMIALLRHVPQSRAELLAGQWRQRQGRELRGRTVGIVGCGHVGKELAELLRGFDCRILAHDILHFPDFYARLGIAPVGLEELLRRSEIVTLHLPLDGSTRGILSRERLALLRPEAILLNLARGGLVDERALKEMLKDGRLAGAALDVFAEEPPEDRELLGLPNLIATPHMGGSSEEAVLAMGRAAIAGLTTARAIDDHWPA